MGYETMAGFPKVNGRKTAKSLKHLMKQLAHFQYNTFDQPSPPVQSRITVLQIQVYPKKNAPEVSKPPRVAKRDFLLILKIFSNLDDIQPSN